MKLSDFVDSLPDDTFESLLLSCIQRANRENRLSWAAIKLLLEVCDKMTLDNVTKRLEQTTKLCGMLKDAAKVWLKGRDD